MFDELFFSLLPEKSHCRFGRNGKVVSLFGSLDPDEFPKDQVNKGIDGLVPQKLSVRRHGSSGDSFFYALYDPFIGNLSEEFSILPEGPGKVGQIGLDSPQSIPPSCMASLT